MPSFATKRNFTTRRWFVFLANSGEQVTQWAGGASSARVSSVSGEPLGNRSGTSSAAVAAFVDISERQRGEKARELLIAALGHDLGNPLQAISLAAESLARRNDVP